MLNNTDSVRTLRQKYIKLSNKFSIERSLLKDKLGAHRNLSETVLRQCYPVQLSVETLQKNSQSAGPDGPL